MSRKKIDKKDFAARLSVLATENGHNPASVAKALGVSRQTVDHWFQGDNLPKPATLKALANMFGFSPTELIYGKTILTENISELPEQPAQAQIGSNDAPEAPKSARESTIAVRGISGTVGRERRSSWHSDPRKNELLHMAAFILQSDDPDITPPFEARIIDAYVSLVRTREPEPEPQIKKTSTPT